MASLNDWDPQKEAFENKNFNPDLGCRQKKGTSDTEFSLFVKGIPLELTQTGFKNLFTTYGNVLSAKILVQKQSVYDSAAGFINYGSLSEAKNAIRNLNGFKIGKHTLRVNHAYGKKKPEDNFSELLQKLEKGPLIDSHLKDLMHKVEDDFSSQNESTYRSNEPVVEFQRQTGTCLKSPPKPQRLVMDEASKHQLFEKKYNRSQEKYHDNKSQNQTFHDVKHRQSSVVEKPVKNSMLHTGEKKQMDIDKDVDVTSKTINPIERKDNSCQVCHKITKMLCGACSVTRYCSQACQAADWKDHKQICKQSKEVSNTKSENYASNRSCNSEFLNENVAHREQSMVQTVVESGRKCIKGQLKKIKSSIELFSSDIAAGNTMDVVVLSILSDCAIIVCQNHDHAYQVKLNNQQISLNKYFRSQTPSGLEFPAVGDVCATVFSEDKQWYRAVIRKILPKNSMLVYYIDYGNTEIVKGDMLMHLDASFCQHPAFSIKCKLAGSKKTTSWSDEQLKFLHSVLQKSNAVLKATFVEIVEDEIFAEFSVGDMSINETIHKKVFLKSAEKVSNSQSDKPKSRGQSEVASSGLSNTVSESDLLSGKASTLNKRENLVTCDRHLESGDSKATEISNESPVFIPTVPEGQFPVLLTFVVDPSCFYCQVVNDDLVLLLQLLENLADYVFSEKTDFIPEVGKCCSAVYAEDGKWCRGKVLKVITPELYLVQYVDFGNTAEVSIKNINHLPNEFALPVLTLQASLSDCFPASHQSWCTEAVSMMKSLENTSCIAEVTQRGKGKVEVILSIGDDASSVNEHLICSGFGITIPKKCRSSADLKGSENNLLDVDMVKECEKQYPVMEPAMHEIVPVHVTSVGQQGLFNCQLIHEGLLDLENLNEKLAVHCKAHQSKSLKKPLPGLCCAAYYTKAETWNRAVVLPTDDCKEIERGSVLVRFVDFGNSEVVGIDHIKLLPDEYIEFPAQALLCSLGDVKPFPGPEWSEAMVTEMNHYVELSNPIIEAQFISKNERQYVIKVPTIVNNLIKKEMAEYTF